MNDTVVKIGPSRDITLNEWTVVKLAPSRGITLNE